MTGARWRVTPRPAPDKRHPDPHVVAVDVDGSPVVSSCATLALTDVPEAWGTAFCLPAARTRAALHLPAPVDPTWLAGAQANVAAAAGWWGGDGTVEIEAPHRAPGRATSRAPRRSRARSWGPRPHLAPERAAGRALCFTGGVDSFFSLLRADHRPTHLLFVVGFDVDLDDAVRGAAVTATLDAVTAHSGTEAVVVHTDLRTHPRFASISWEHTHGAALAAMAHLLHATIGMLVIPPSYAHERLVPWGSRPDFDPRWSVPGRLRIEHGDATGRRLDRVLAIAGHPLVHQHLRVCWQNVAGTLNCGRCEKCVRTMVMLAGADQLQRCRTFPDRAELPARLAALGSIGAEHAVMWADLVDLPLRPDERSAVARLLDAPT
ncbi:MAG: hypothetical protein JWM89_3265 [Acidimicrobiales bacterium]|nr:hypothetical protein [Acidimicrobiales bacterium]